MTTKAPSPLRTDFLAGLALLLPALISIAVVVWFFGTVSNITDMLLFAVPDQWKYIGGTRGDLHWYWRLAASAFRHRVGHSARPLTRHYLAGNSPSIADDTPPARAAGEQDLQHRQAGERGLCRQQSSFQQAVLVQFPRAGMYSLGFITSDQRNEVQFKTPQNVWSVFVPTTPKPKRADFWFMCPTKSSFASKCRSPTPSRASSASAPWPRNTPR